jgi:hypothetical protein
MHICNQGVLLVSRTLLTELISQIEAWSGSTLVTLVGGWWVGRSRQAPAW